MRRKCRLYRPGLLTGRAGVLLAMILAAVVLSAGRARAFDPAQSLSLPKDTATGLQNAVAIQKNTGLLVPNAGSAIYDTTVPLPGIATAPGHANANPVTIAYANAADDGGSNIKTVGLWVKYGASGVWGDTGLTSTGVSGSFTYSADLGNGQYSFALKAEDNAGNQSADPAGAGDTQLVYDTAKPVIAMVGGDVTIEVGSTYTDAGATAADAQDGDLTSKMVTVNSVNTAVVGVCTVTYNVSDAAGNAATQVIRTVTVAAAPRFAVNIFQPAHGSILVSPLPGTDGKYGTGAALTFTYKPDTTAAYDLTAWSGATQDAANANLAHLTIANAPANVSVTLARQTGSVSVSVTPASATWTVTDGDNATHDGTGSQVLSKIPTGAVSIVYKPISGMTAPASQSATLAKGATTPFSGTYTTSATYTVSAPTNLSGAPGQPVDCAISLSDATGLTAYSIQIGLDSTLVDCTTVSPGTVVASWGNPTAAIAAGSVTISGAGPALGGGSGSLAVLRLRVKDGAAPATQTAIRFVGVSLNAGKLTAVSQDGNLTIQGGTYTWGDVDSDKTVGVLDADMILKFKTELAGSLPDPAAADVSGDTPSAIGTLDAALILKKSIGAITKFPADANGDSMGPEPPAPAGAKLTSDAQKIIEGLQKAATPRIISTAGTLTLAPNAQVLLPISLDDANAVQGYFFQVSYDDSRLEFVSLDKGSLTREWGDPTVNPQPGRILVAGAGVKALSGSGSLAVLLFKARSTVAAGVSAPFSVDGAELNDGAIPSQFQAVTGAPVLSSISPATGASTGGTMVTIKCTNLDAVDNILFGAEPALWFRIDVKSSSIQAITPVGTGTVNVTVSAPGGTNALTKAFSFFTPDVYLEMSPAAEVVAGSVLDVPVTLTTPGVGKPTGVTFTLQFEPKLFAVKTSGTPNEQVSIGATAASAGKSVLSIEPRAGKVIVTIGTKGSVGSVIPDGDLCTVHLLAISNATNTDGLLYIADVSAATSSGAKSLKAAAGALPKRSATEAR
ncbi:MAG: DUF5011 domain-containing protein [Candidatus Hydrogenedentes bacterium]|nr:DUF5011 domain-containing protein [Candidatus Hydrogenedentota bacterium]